LKTYFRILAINPEPTPTKLAFYRNEKAILHETIIHSNKYLTSCNLIKDAIILTGINSSFNKFNKILKDRISFISLLMVYQGKEKMLSLYQGALRILS